MPSSRLIGAGAFVIAGFLLFAVGLFLIGERRQFFAEKFEIYTEFARVSGLQPGAPVRVSGMDAGEVLDIQVPPGPASKFKIKLSVRERLHPIVRADSVASIQTEGLVGGTFLQISVGSERSPRAATDSTLPSREPFDFADLMRQMSETVTTINDTITELKGDVESTVQTIAETASHADVLVEQVGDDVRSIAAAGRKIADDTRAITEGVRAGRGTIGKLVNDDELYRRAQGIAREAEQTVRNVKEASDQAKQALTSLQSTGGPAQGLASDLRQTLNDAREALADLSENTEALKHNFFFRGFFNKRGYFDLDQISADAYRQGVLAGDKRSPLRIWLDARVLFEAASGSVQLSPGGKTRLDSAMAEFLRYPRQNPLMIEGYASAGSRDQAFLDARARAVLVREYLTAKFHLNPHTVGLMPLGAQAPGNPSGDDTWDGVALALFVDNAELAADRKSSSKD